ncbi:hypothetical protein ERJ75_001094100 [Trypanosoma vivax]|nr:hypothetical protein ERJ75_001094100 [Trypanosoma vivax]
MRRRRMGQEEGRRRQRNGEGVPHAENSGPPPSKANREVPGGVFATMQDAERAGTEAEVSHSIELQPGSETNMQTLAETFAWQRASSALAELRAWRGCRKGERRRGEQRKQTTTLNAWKETLGGKGPGKTGTGLGVCTALREARQRKQDGGGHEEDTCGKLKAGTLSKVVLRGLLVLRVWRWNGREGEGTVMTHGKASRAREPADTAEGTAFAARRDAEGSECGNG